MSTFKIVRFFQGGKAKQTVRGKTGLSLAEAQAYVLNPQASSRTCTTAAGRARTRRYGEWMEGYRMDSK
jgi:hypothetical protein